jgi:hypothetical protein
MPSCATCGGTEDVRLYERHDDRDAPRWWWCVDCSSLAARHDGIAVDHAPGWVERAALHRLPARSVEDPLYRHAYAGRRATDRRLGVAGRD